MISMPTTKFSLSIILGFIVIFTTLVVMGLDAIYEYQTITKQIIEEIQTDSKSSVMALEKNIVNFISAYAPHEYELLVKTEIELHRNHMAIIVEDYNIGKLLGRESFISGKIRDSNWNIIDYDSENSDQKQKLEQAYHSIKHPISAPTGEILGTLTLYTSDHFLKLEINNIIKETLTQIFIITFLLTVLLISTIRYFILKPLSDIIAIINNSDNDGIPLEQIPEHNSKEIATLSSSMNNMITSIRESRIKLHEQNRKLQFLSRVFNDTREGIIITNTQKEIVEVNPAFSDTTGYSREDIIGKNPGILSSGRQSRKFYQQMWQEINGYGHWQGEVWNRKKGGELYAALLSISVLKNEQNEITNYFGIFTDITSSKKQQEKLNLMAHYDILTSLPNRALFADRFHQAIVHSKRTQHKLAVCFLDLDNFKPVNDNYGHEVGDKLLREVATRITANIREEDTVSRQGGDEFTLLLNDIESYGQCEFTVERLLHALAQPYLIDDTLHNITASIGVTLYPDDNEDIDTLIRHADNAMYQAKISGKHRYQIFDSRHDQLLVKKHHHIAEIEHALINNELSLYYQPKVNMVTGNVFGAEALIRWNHPEKGLIPPLDFLPMIDGTDIELELGDWVIKQAMQQIDNWLNQGIGLEVSINITSNHLLSNLFFDNLQRILAQYPGVDAKYLQLEILESSALGDLNAISKIIITCQQAFGINIALDDFGTGYSSLTHLRNLTANIIKIDQSFVRDMLDDPSDYAIIDGIIGLADSFGREVIAEGVETTEHGLVLLLMGCKEAQGYGIAKPMPADDFIVWLLNYQPNQQWLEYGNKVCTAKEHKLKLFKLLSTHWMTLFVKNIQAVPEEIMYWPIMNCEDDPCAHLINHERKEQLFTTESLNRLDEAHNNFHTIAQAIKLKYEEGDISAAREGLSELQNAFDEMNNTLAGP